MNGLPRKLEIHRHRHQAGAHDAEIGRKIFRPVGRQNGDAIPAGKAAPQQRARSAVGHGVEPGMAEFARRLLAAEIDDRGLAGIAIAANEVAEVGECSHRARIRLGRPADPHPFGGAVR